MNLNYSLAYYYSKTDASFIIISYYKPNIALFIVSLIGLLKVHQYVVPSAFAFGSQVRWHSNLTPDVRSPKRILLIAPFSNWEFACSFAPWIKPTFQQSKASTGRNKQVILLFTRIIIHWLALFGLEFAKGMLVSRLLCFDMSDNVSTSNKQTKTV